NFICVQCGAQFSQNAEPPPRCPICQDERQFVRHDGQQWTTLQELALHHRNRIEKRQHAFTASERNRNSQLLNALCWCSRPQEICCGIAFHCSRATRSQKSGRAEVFGRSRSRIRTFIPQ